MSDLTRRIAQMPIEERIRLEERLLAARKNGAAQRIPRRADDGPAPLSFAQERLWFLAQFEPDSAAYNETQVVRMRGALDIPALERSLDSLAERHDSLRVCFREIDGSLMQVADPLPPRSIPLMDLQELDADAQLTAAWAAIDRTTNQIFDLTQPPLWRTLLIRLGPDDHLWVKVMHHIISDGWSSTIFRRDLGALYAAHSSRPKLSPLPSLPVSYADFSVWQRERLQGERLEKLVDFWRSRLAGVQPLNLPTDHPRPLHPSHRGKSYHFEIPLGVSESLKRVAQSADATFYMLLLAAFQLLLHRYTGQDDIVVGSSIANRTRPEIEDLHGFFVNTLLMRADCSGNPTFRGLLAQVRQNALAAYQHQDLPFAKLVAELQPNRELGRNPFYDVTFALQNVPRAELELPGLQCERVHRPENISNKFDLSLFLYESAEGLAGRLEYAADLFEPSTIERFANHFANLLEAIAANPDCPIEELSLFTEAERRQLLVEWNDTRVEFPADLCVHHLFEAQVEKTPDAVAVQCADRQLTFRELNHQANQLAQALIGVGIGPEIAVGLAVEPSIEMVVGVLGILKAGGAYVPLSQETPKERQLAILQDADCRALVTPARHPLAALPLPYPLIDLDALPAGNANSTGGFGPPNPTVHAGNLAYILYTSGSTGKPKGVAVEHRQVVQYGLGVSERCRFQPGMSYAMVQPLTVDSSVTMLFPPLWTGGLLHIIPRELALDPEALADYFSRHRIDCLKIAPSHLAALLPAQVLPQQRLIIGGEPSRWQWVRELRRRTEAAIYNHYGPTETTVGVLTFPVETTTAAYRTTPIGRPLPNSQVYVLSPYLQPVPIGSTGQLYIGGSLVARGYLHNAELTAAGFIPNPFGPGRLYKTGDFVRYLPDGALEFVGREDRQVKIRGFRIELGDVEAALAGHPDVTEALVIKKETGSDAQLHAYFVGKQPISGEQLRAFLREKLPPVMIPAGFTQLGAMPRTPHGKLDYRALPEPEATGTARNGHFAAPRTPTEDRISAIWSQMLGVEEVGIHEDFFALGGHSLKAVQVISRVRDSFQVDVALRHFFEEPTVAGLGRRVEAILWHTDGAFGEAMAEGEDGEL